MRRKPGLERVDSGECGAHATSAGDASSWEAKPAEDHNTAAMDYSMRRPEMARLMTSSWICSVPSKMSKIFATDQRTEEFNA